MDFKNKKILITSALPYPTGPLHLGRVVGAYLPADIYYRFIKAMGGDVVWVCGTDDHGVGIEIAAAKEHTTEEEITQRYNKFYKDTFSRIGIDFDIFSKTHTPEHEQMAREFFEKINKNGFLEKRAQLQAYCNSCHQFLPDRYIEGICPHCKSAGARGDQCEVCGKVLDPIDLIDPECKICGSKDIMQKETHHYYLLLSKFQDVLKTWIDTKKDTWKKNVFSAAYKWLDEGLEDRAITRDIKRGINVPGDEAKKMYVWFEALIGYVSFSKQLGDKIGRDLVKEFWQNPDAEIVHFIGKDNIVFHTIIWPAIIMAYNNGQQNFNLPTQVAGNEFLNLEGKKFSTSRNYAVWLNEIVEAFDPDAIRYYLIHCIPERRDSNFSWTEFKDKNNELANILGNLINRVVTFSTNKFDGKFEKIKDFDEIQKELLVKLENTKQNIASNLSEFRFRDGLSEVLAFVQELNKYFNDSAPWTLKDNPQKAKNIIDFCLMMIYKLSLMLNIFLPFTAQKLLDIFGLQNDGLAWDGELADTEIKINNPGILFKKLEDSDIQPWIEKIQN